MKRLFLLLGSALANIDTLHAKVSGVYDAWNVVYGLLKSLKTPAPVVVANDPAPLSVTLPAGWPLASTQPVAVPAPVVVPVDSPVI